MYNKISNNFKSNKALSYHLNICKEKNNGTIIELEETIRELKDNKIILEEEIKTLNNKINEQPNK